MFWLLQITLLGMPRLFPKELKQHWPQLNYCGNNFILHYGFPSKIITDQGRNFESELIEHLYQLAGVQKLRTSPITPRLMGSVKGLMAHS